jgi:hypothetical protein
MLKRLAQRGLQSAGVEVRRYRPEQEFRSDHYVRHNARRQEHLASLGLPVARRTVLEVGAGVGDHSQYFLDRDCKLTITEGRPENVEIIRKRFRGTPVYVLDMDAPEPVSGHPFEVIYCYGLLYHLKNPAQAIQYLGQHTTGQLLLETCVSFDTDERINPVEEPIDNPTQAVVGLGCRPSRPWIFTQLKLAFPHVYATRTQPNHEEFPIDWTRREAHVGLSRAVFVASKTPIENEHLAPTLLMHQQRHA